MKAIPALSIPSKKTENITLLPQTAAKKTRRRRTSSLSKIDLMPGKPKKPWSKFYKVFKNETAVTSVFTNNFKIFQPTLLKIKAACALNSREHPTFSLPADKLMFYGFLSRTKTMEYAKAGALKYINKLIDEGEKSYGLLIKYRETHYEDLNINLTERNIRKLEMLSGE